MPGSASSSQSPKRSRRSTGSSAPPLQTINEGHNAVPPPIPAKSSLRNGSDVNLPQGAAPTPPRLPWLSSGNSRDTSTDTGRTAPPAYERVAGPEPLDNNDEYLDNGPVEGEKLAALRKSGGFRRNRRGLMIGLIALAALIVLGLAVGLGVGLTVGRDNSSNDVSGAPAPAPDNTTANQAFPLGQYSIVTALRTVDTSCTSNAATWRCYPYATYNAADAGTETSSRSTFTWTITNTSSVYATNMTASTPDAGVPANLTISATSNPFGITFNDTDLTYISTASNSTSPRYVFSFIMPKGVFPSASITADNTNTECFFNQTTFTGTLYLSAERTYPTGADRNDTTQWPYAVEVSQTSPANDVPACYEFINGAVGAMVTDFTTPLTAGTSPCSCDYRNY